MSENWPIWIIKIEWGMRFCQVEVGFIKRPDGSDILPISFKIISNNFVGVDGMGDDLFSKIIHVQFLKKLIQGLKF